MFSQKREPEKSNAKKIDLTLLHGYYFSVYYLLAVNDERIIHAGDLQVFRNYH